MAGSRLRKTSRKTCFNWVVCDEPDRPGRFIILGNLFIGWWWTPGGNSGQPGCVHLAGKLIYPRAPNSFRLVEMPTTRECSPAGKASIPSNYLGRLPGGDDLLYGERSPVGRVEQSLCYKVISPRVTVRTPWSGRLVGKADYPANSLERSPAGIGWLYGERLPGGNSERSNEFGAGSPGRKPCQTGRFTWQRTFTLGELAGVDHLARKSPCPGNAHLAW